MGLFSKLFKRKEKYVPTTKETYSVQNSVMQESPLGNAPGTSLPEATIRNVIAAVLKKDPSKVNLAAMDWLSPTEEFGSMNYEHNTDKGYSAVVSGGGKSYRVVIGSAPHVRHAATDISNEMRALIEMDLDPKATLHLAAIDGIIYAGWTVIRQSVTY